MTQMDMFTKSLTKAQQEMLGRITHALHGMGCKFFIVTPDGEKYGNIKEEAVPAKPQRRKRPLKFAFGFKTNYVKPYLKDLDVGQVAEIPFHEVMTVTDLVSTASSTATHMWGKGAATVMAYTKNRTVEVLRTGGI